jgi:hypothetical protein
MALLILVPLACGSGDNTANRNADRFEDFYYANIAKMDRAEAEELGYSIRCIAEDINHYLCQVANEVLTVSEVHEEHGQMRFTCPSGWAKMSDCLVEEA